MADVVFVAVLVGFFALAVVLVKLCERIIGAETVTLDVPEDAEPFEAAA